MKYSSDTLGITLIACFAIMASLYIVGTTFAYGLPRINPLEIPYTPCGQQLIKVEPVAIGGSQCLQLTYADGSMNHLCKEHPQS